MTFFAKGLIELYLLLLLFLKHGGLEGRIPELMLFDMRLACALLIVGLVKFSGSGATIMLVESDKRCLIIIVSAANHVKVASRSPQA